MSSTPKTNSLRMITDFSIKSRFGATFNWSCKVPDLNIERKCSNNSRHSRFVREQIDSKMQVDEGMQWQPEGKQSNSARSIDQLS